MSFIWGVDCICISTGTVSDRNGRFPGFFGKKKDPTSKDEARQAYRSSRHIRQYCRLAYHTVYGIEKHEAKPLPTSHRRHISERKLRGRNPFTLRDTVLAKKDPTGQREARSDRAGRRTQQGCASRWGAMSEATVTCSEPLPTSRLPHSPQLYICSPRLMSLHTALFLLQRKEIMDVAPGQSHVDP